MSAAAQAPASIWPSIDTLITPDRSQSTPAGRRIEYLRQVQRRHPVGAADDGTRPSASVAAWLTRQVPCCRPALNSRSPDCRFQCQTMDRTRSRRLQSARARLSTSSLRDRSAPPPISGRRNHPPAAASYVQTPAAAPSPDIAVDQHASVRQRHRCRSRYRIKSAISPAVVQYTRYLRYALAQYGHEEPASTAQTSSAVPTMMPLKIGSTVRNVFIAFISLV